MYLNPSFLFPNGRGGVNTCEALVVTGTLTDSGGTRDVTQVLINQSSFELGLSRNVMLAAESVVSLMFGEILLELLAARPELRERLVEWFFRLGAKDAVLSHVTRVRPVIELARSWRWDVPEMRRYETRAWDIRGLSFEGWAYAEELLFVQHLATLPGGGLGLASRSVD